ncbi:MAG TPA: MFS transporter [Lachnospiraceae bacterium]|jgi:fucose permease|nr:MFS transporter [Lachnospiraceae bacterium]HBY72363.1 MFS transporter [Lachnospiraceae bacterium]HCA70414.1 MFS transporter [Lachnospiraceae bacterium]HCM13168.1 MFS transporter [Lachnospiraceae bacterium]HCR41170.1 MFS transporter [Lachnospiraceae bacterium]
MSKKQYTYKHTTYACYRGYITQAIINNLAPLLFIIFQTSFHISYDKLGQLILINFGTQLLTDIWATKYADHYGYRKCMVAAHALCTAGLLSLSFLPFIMPSPYLGLVISVILYATGGGLLEVIVSPIVEALPNDNKESAMALLHSFYCWGQMIVVLLSTIVLRLVGRDLWFLLPLLWSLFPLYNAFKFLHVPLLPLVQDGNGMKLKELLSNPGFYLSMLLMICAGASELSMSQWSSLFAEKGLQVPKLVGDILGPGVFALFMAIGRTIYGYYGERLPMKGCLIGSSILCILTYLATVLTSNPFLSLLACSLTGLSVCLMWPGTFSLSSAAFPKGGTLMFGILAICGDLGCSTGPWIAGILSNRIQETGESLPLLTNRGFDLEQLGLRSGLLACTIFPVLMLLGLLAFRKKSFKTGL